MNSQLKSALRFDGLLGFGGGCRRDLANGTPESILAAVSAMLARGINELLALALAVVGGRFALGHEATLVDLLAYREVRHG